jgi:hypothetical protein
MMMMMINERFKKNDAVSNQGDHWIVAINGQASVAVIMSITAATVLHTRLSSALYFTLK